MLTLIEKVEASVDAEAAAEARAQKSLAGEFTLEDLREQLAVDEEDGAAREPARPAAEGGRVSRR